MKRKVLIVGGVAGGASAAARLRRLDESAEIVVFEKGQYVSFANCGLPYHIGGEIETRHRLLLHTPESLKARFCLDVRIETEVIAIQPDQKSVRYRHLPSGKEGEESYDDLIIATGSIPLRPPIPGLELPGILTLRDIADMDKIIDWLNEKKPTHATVIGGGFIGLEMVEQLGRRNIRVTLVEAAAQVLPPLDPELAEIIHEELSSKGIETFLEQPVQSFSRDSSNDSLIVHTKDGHQIQTGLVIFGIGVRPEVTLAKSAQLALGSTGGILVNSKLQTSAPHIWAIGDCVEVNHAVSGTPMLIPLAGPANRQGRLVADNVCGADREYRGSYGSAVVRCFSYTVACTGLNEKVLKKLELPYQAIHLHPNSHAGYYPGASRLSLKVLFHPSSGEIYGAQAVGKEGVEKRIDVIATALRGKLRVEDLTEVELCYSPPYGSAKDPINLAGMMGENIRRNLASYVTYSQIPTDAFLLDVRDPKEVEKGVLPGSHHIPLHDLRSRYQELPRDRLIVAYCQSGQRSYYAVRILSQLGFRVQNLSGAYLTSQASIAVAKRLP